MAIPHASLIDLAAERSPRPFADSDLLLQSAFEHRMHGLLWRSVQRNEIEVSDRVRSVLSTEMVYTEMRHIGLWDALTNASGRLAAAGIEVASIKGVAAERLWYLGMGDRPCWDVDLLLAPHQLDRAREALELIHPGHKMAPTIQGLVDGGNIQGLPLRFGTTEIDLHFDLFKYGYPSRQADIVWERTVELVLDDGSTIRVLDPEISLVHFLYHLNRDKFKRLLGYADIARILASDSLDRRFVDRFVKFEGLSTQHPLALRAVADTLDLVTAELAVPRGWRAAVWQVAWRPSTRLLGMAAEYRFARRGPLLLPMMVRRRGFDAVRYWLKRLIPPAAVIDFNHPQTKGPYVWRMISGRVQHRWRRWLSSRSQVRSEEERRQ